MGLKKRTKVNAEFNMSSLTDIIFLLLIFFMLTSSLTNPNNKNLDRPKSDSTTPSPQNVHVAVENGVYFIESEEVSLSNLEIQLGNRIEMERIENQKNGIAPEKVTVVLSVSKDERTATIIEMMKLSDKLKARLILATDPPKK